MSERASYLWGGVLRTLLILLTACSTAEGGRCPKSCSCHVPNEVHCTFRYLTSVPEHIQPTVEKMNLGYNSIAMLKENDLTGLKNLELLMLHSNTIHNTEDGAFKDLKSLQVLKMSYNKLKKINKETFTGLESVIRLHLDHNHLEFIHPNAFYGLTTLQLVNLEGNYLQQIHSHTFITLRYNQLFAVSSVKTIHLSDNLLSSLPADTFPSSVQLENLFLHGNPWSCDCRMAWFTKWRIMNVGVLKCKRDRRGQLCPVCQNPSIHHNKTLSLISSDAFICTRPAIQPHLKNKNITLDEGEYSQLLPKDFIAPLGSIQINLTDHFHNEGSLSCTVQRPSASENLTLVSGEDGTNHITVTMTTYLICNVDHEHMPQLWQILAIYSDSPMQLRRGEMTAKTPEMKYRYSQIKPMDEDDDFHTNIEAVIKASPALLMQPEINLQLDRTATTFSTLIIFIFIIFVLFKNLVKYVKKSIYLILTLIFNTGAVAQFSCEVVGEPKPIMEWILPDGSKVRAPYSSEDKRLLISADGKCTIRGVAPSDIGLYHCIATNYLDADILTFRLNVLSPDVEDDEINGLQLTKPLGERLMLECGATGSPKPSIKWILPDHSILESSQDKKKVYENGSLVVESLTKRDRGFYRCQVSNQLGVDLLVSHVLVTGEEPKAVTVLDQDEENILDKTNVDKVDTENPSIGKTSQESRTVTSDRPYPRLRSRDREHLESRLGHRRRGPFSSRNRVLHRSYKKLDPERFAQFLNNIKNKERTHSGSNTESNIFSGDGDVSSGENPDDVILPQLVKPITTKPENLGTTESYFQHRPTQTNNLVTLKYFPESQKCECGIDGAKTAVRDVQVLTPTASPAQRPTSIQYTNTNSDIPLKQPTHAGPRELPSTRDYITSADAPESAPTTDPVLITNQEASETTKGRISWNRPLRRENTGSYARKPSITPTISTTAETTTVTATTTPAAVPTIEANGIVIPATIFTPTHSHVKENSGDDDFGEFSADFEFTTQKPRYQAYTTASYYSSTITQTLAESQTLPSPPTVKPPTAINEDVISGSGGLPNIWFGRKKPSRTKGRHGQRRKPIRGRRPTNKDHADPPRTRGTTKLPKVTTKSPATSYTEQESVFTSGRSSRFTTHAPRMTSARTYSTTLMPTTTRAFYPTAFSRVPDNITPTQKVTTYRPQITRPVLKSTISSGQRRTNTPSYQSNSPSKVHPSVTTGQSATIVSRVPFESTSILMTSKPRIIGGNAASFTVLSDSDAFLPCDAVGNPQPTISWRRFSTVTVGKFAVLENGTLLIQNANIKDRGQYLCLAENNQGSDKLLVTLSVVAYPSRILEPKMRELKSHTGNRVEISCKAEGRPAPMITWILANRTQVRGQKSQGRVTVSDQGTLVIEQVSVYDRGHYKCIASNPAGADTASVKLQVVAAPPGILEEKRQVIRISATQNIWLPCTSIGSPQPTIHWVLFDGTVIPTNRGIRGSRITVHHNGTLHIKDVLLSDSGKYECIATSSTGSERRVVTLMVEKYETMPQIMQISQRLTELYFGDQLTLNCTAKGEPTPRIIWRLPSKAVVDQWHRMGSRMQVLENGTLLINSVSDKDAGEYLCVARNTIGDDLQLLRVRVSMKPAKIETKLLDKKQVTFGKDLKVDCKASGAPKPEISWGLPDGTVVNSVYQSDSSIGGGGGGGRTRRYTLFDNGTLYLNQVGMSEEGDYTCYAENQVGKDEMHVHITVVTAAPHIHTPAQAQVRVKSRGNVRLDCHAVGEPKPKILWMLPSKDVIAASNERYLVHVNGSLEIRDVKLGDVGDYICKARNPAGESRKVYKVEIDGNIPMINGYNQNRTVIKDIAAKYSRKLMDCKAEGDPTPTVTWIMPDNIFLSAPYFGSRINVHHNGTLEIKNVRPTDTAEFICIARNDGGEAVMVVQLQVIGTMQRPIFKNPFNERIVSRIGKTVVLNCSASGHPAPEIFWTLPNGTRFNQIQGHISRHHVSNDGSLVIHSSQKEDAGKYRCGAKNYMGYIEKLVLLEVGQQPYILTRPRGIIRSVSGEPLFLHCLSDGNPRPSISWTLPGGHTLARPQVLGRYQLLENGTLIIQDTTAHDRGSYVCRARNEAGEAVLTVPVLIIAYPPRITTGPPASVRAIRGAPLQLHCVAVGIPKAEITWELPNHSLLSTAEQGWPTGSELLHPQGTLIIQRPTLSDSGTYKCLAKNYLGTDAKATYVRVL
uniref:Ig-like domain-containing protein n=1 Tax=Periophthalmus magnuspinnatus TaxID=409849 RepID=A0A3B4AIW7_9GOBI